MFVLSLVIFFVALFVRTLFSLCIFVPACCSQRLFSHSLPFPSIHFSTFFCAFTFHSMMYTYMHESILSWCVCTRVFLAAAIRSLTTHNSALALPFPSFLPNFFPLVPLDVYYIRAKNIYFILFSFKFLFRYHWNEQWLGVVRWMDVSKS